MTLLRFHDPALDEVEQRQARGLVALGDRHDQAQVGLDEGLLGVGPGPGQGVELAPAPGRDRL